VCVATSSSPVSVCARCISWIGSGPLHCERMRSTHPSREGPQGVRGRNFDHAKIGALGWEPHVSLIDGLKITYDWVEDLVRESS